MHEGQKKTTAFWVSKTRHAPTLSNSSEQCINPIRKWARLRYLCVFVKPQPLKTKSECWPYFWRSLAGVDWSGVQQYQSVISPPSSVVSELPKSLKEIVCSTLVDLITQMAVFVFSSTFLQAKQHFTGKKSQLLGLDRDEGSTGARTLGESLWHISLVTRVPTFDWYVLTVLTSLEEVFSKAVA